MTQGLALNRRFQDTWLRCPNCGNETTFEFITGGHKFITQYPEDNTREESGFFPMDNEESDQVSCRECEYYDYYLKFATDL